MYVVLFFKDIFLRSIQAFNSKFFFTWLANYVWRCIINISILNNDGVINFNLPTFVSSRQRCFIFFLLMVHSTKYAKLTK